MLQSVGSQRVGHDLVIKRQQQQENQHRKETKNSDTEGADFNTIGGQYDKCVVVRSKSDIVQAVT